MTDYDLTLYLSMLHADGEENWTLSDTLYLFKIIGSTKLQGKKI